MVEHYLISINLAPRPSRLHAYLITMDKADVENVAHYMLDFVEKNLGRVMLPIFLATRLLDKAHEVREELCRRDERVREGLATADDFYVAIWEMPTDDPWDEPLMTLH